MTNELAFAWYDSGLVTPIPILPPELIRSLSAPLVSAAIVSLAGNLIEVFVSPVWTILSAILILPPKVEIPVTFKSPAPTAPLILFDVIVST